MASLAADLTTMTTLWAYVDLTVFLLYRLFALICFVLALVAFFKCLTKNQERFIAMDKRTKQFWLGITGGASALALVSMLGLGPFVLLMSSAAACMATVYLVDVNPEVS
ncbi:DUF2516 family protein [Nesterenkonia alba]|uniref:DUF2516 family protein n=1 Tax=Nesterenkonia alba TaxID=515814 RepID=UPI0003B79A77|nr:DUF2516 family protein [Nesterenkonia alba]